MKNDTQSFITQRIHSLAPKQTNKLAALVKDIKKNVWTQHFDINQSFECKNVLSATLFKSTKNLLASTSCNVHVIGQKSLIQQHYKYPFSLWYCGDKSIREVTPSSKEGAHLNH